MGDGLLSGDVVVMGVVPPTLYHEARNYTVKNAAIVMLVAYIAQEVGHGVGYLVRVQLYDKAAHRSREFNLRMGRVCWC